jgi:hypothetical protein
VERFYPPPLFSNDKLKPMNKKGCGAISHPFLPSFF